MRQAQVIQILKLSSLPDQDVGDQPVYFVRTNWTKDKQNSFYMDPVDDKVYRVDVPTTAEGEPDNPNMINWNDDIVYDKQKFLSKVVIWKGRRFKQRGYSFDGR